MDKKNRSNQVLLLLILFLDLMGFTLIFPLIPDLLSNYFTNTGLHSIDFWVKDLLVFLTDLLPDDRQEPEDVIIIAGGVLASLYSILMFLAAPWWGRLSDRIGRRPVLLISSLGLSLSYLVWAFSPNFTLFALSRILGGIMAGNMGVASAAMADMTTPQKRTQAMGMVGAAFGLGMLFGPMFGGLSSIIPWQGLAQISGYLHRFSIPAFFACLISLISFLLNSWKLRETLDEKNKHVHPWIENPFSIMRRNFNKPVMIMILMLNLFYLFSFSAFEFGFSFYYKLDFNLTPLEIGFVFLYIGVVLVIGQGGLVRALSKRIPAKSILLLGLLIMPVPMILFAYTAPNVWLSLVVLFPVAIGASLFQPGASGMMSLHADEAQQGIALGTLRSFGSLGRATGPVFGAWLYWYYGIEVAYWATALVLVVLLLVALPLKQPEREVLEKKK